MRVAVIGRGAWGQALAVLAGCDGPVVADASNADALILAVPTNAVAARLAETPPGDRPVLLCAKGLEPGSARLPFEIAAVVAPGAVSAVLAGPTFAHEVAAGLPAAAVIAAADAAQAAAWTQRLGAPTFRLYASDDPVGASIGGAVKNVIAVAAGAVIGRALGENARAAVIARGLAEMVRYAIARGGREETLMGLSGLGDLVLTCGSKSSRNMAFGFALGRGESVAHALAVSDGVVEGAATAATLAEDAARRNIEMPIASAVAELVAGAIDVAQAIDRLLARPARAEGW